MNVRVPATELRRSTAPWAGALVLGTALAFLYALGGGPWWRGTAAWTEQWTSMALWTRSLLVFLWPLAVGLGALQGLRDHRSRMTELLASTPRPAWHRGAAVAGTTALTLVSAYALLVLLGGVQVFANTSYGHAGWLPVSLVGAFALVAGAVLGMGAARALPSALTPPALAVAAFAVTVLCQPSPDEAVPTPLAPNRLSLLSPAAAQVREALLTLSASAHTGQALWLLGMAATGFALLTAVSRRARLLALTPVLAGAALALLVLPSDPRHTYVVDEAAAERVCDGPVCVTAMHQGRLADVAGPARRALRLLRTALGDGAPATVRESTALRGIGDTPERSSRTVLVDFDDGMIAGAKGEDLTRALIAQALAPACFARSDRESGITGELAAQSVAAGWVLGDLEPFGGTVHAADDQLALARPVWKRLTALPRAEQLARITAARDAALRCEGFTLDVLNGGATR
ncbi:hypothetical protein DVA86_31155 [Streptomyces armeniacus]|uniref:Uncharacterized protein n=1 Tax=Streptomyces armeniacus TaxID=83291 RepID=A0A345XXL4_9ACTN|nr:hypothetical protein [Streptomyces armeniacus]AXK36380.1 hypothetical protein DVA86_31155 [Streptomyces armeniacus]